MGVDIDDILTLLAITILADKKVFSEEIETFLDVARRVTEEMDIDENLSESKLLAWLYANQDRVKSMLRAHDFEQNLTELFIRLHSIADKNPLLDNMVDIAKCDDEFHVSEKALIVLASRHWQTTPPSFTEQ